MAAPQGPPNHREGPPTGASYSQVIANENAAAGVKRPAFEPPPDLRATLLEEGTFKDRDMDIDPDRRIASAKASAPWIPGKCIPQAPQAPKYVVRSPRIEEQKQYMRDNALVGKFLGLWPSERI
jgi:hypothetical protein